MLLLGLTGSIATGKSTVSSLLRTAPYNLPIIDADVIARQVVEPGTPGYKKIVEYFGPTTPDLLLPTDDPVCGGKENGKDGKGRPLNRPALGRRVFGTSEDRVKDRKVLNGIVHPAVGKAIYKAIFYYFITGHWAVVLDIPLLFESGWERYCGNVMVVAVSDPAVQMKRLRERDPHLTAEDAENRVKSQGDVREKARRALARGEKRGVVVWNDGDKEDLKRELAKVMKEVQAASPQWWAYACLVCPPLAAASAAYNIWINWRAQKAWTESKEKEKAKL
ncbi:dephospho-CoA kinase [Verruconis gallopava]|uniref:Dephospho-CoA kinase n=1 Tax=Verruconis gallopava TaxID=253628 RepID=A0A0D2ALS7_9PEZI|nr:dephospho-CoA kinase [Verruconis gallopava]KIW07440.1 dephospho-CoA kinase [Verruconis gallopava]